MKLLSAIEKFPVDEKKNKFKQTKKVSFIHAMLAIIKVLQIYKKKGWGLLFLGKSNNGTVQGHYCPYPLSCDLLVSILTAKKKFKKKHNFAYFFKFTHTKRF